jgi:NTP pyrophosphatase (non-canonical NTP hydrolase)
MNMFELHKKMTAHLFPAFSSTDERFLALGLCGEAGELANMIKKRWRDGVDLTEEIRDEIADVRIYLELLAKCFDIEGEKLDNLMAKIDSSLLSEDERFLALALCGRAGKLADYIVSRWRRNADFKEEIRDEIVDIRICIELLAKCFEIEGEKLDKQVAAKLQLVANKHLKTLRDKAREWVNR